MQIESSTMFCTGFPEGELPIILGVQINFTVNHIWGLEEEIVKCKELQKAQ